MEQVFEITITGLEGHAWQGLLCRDGEEVPFRSEVELLMELDRLIAAYAACGA